MAAKFACLLVMNAPDFRLSSSIKVVNSRRIQNMTVLIEKKARIYSFVMDIFCGFYLVNRFSVLD